ncbi:cytochrome P450 89A2-like [Aristolochia californica]|uniref:cytochrome P450 89A2-like n=1 Tax=Aristolochia californica TaxID=171875 RepID=UPI0035DB60A5
MGTWLFFFLAISLFVSLVILQGRKSEKRKLPPGPPALPLIGNPLWLFRSYNSLEPAIRQAWAKYGPIVTLRMGPQPAIFISDRALAHEALIQKGAIFANRPWLATSKDSPFANSQQYTVVGGSYGPTWRLLRRNLTSEILNPSTIKSYSPHRDWMLKILIETIESESQSGEHTVNIRQCFYHSLFRLLLLMCFGQKLDEKHAKEIGYTQNRLLVHLDKNIIFSIFPVIGKFLFRKNWDEVVKLRQKQAELFLRLVRARKEKGKKNHSDENSISHCYVDSLLALELPEEGDRNLSESEIINLCSEFLDAGTDTTSSALQWVMANVVKYPEVQEKIVQEIGRVLAEGTEEKDPKIIGEEELQKMKYLRAVVHEALRRHPPAHFVLPHCATKRAEINGYDIPTNAMINFAVLEMGLDEKMWEDPLKFKPERFLHKEELDFTGSEQIKIMPFGVGRRICPGLALAMLHLQFTVANLVREFEWKTKEGEEVDLSGKGEFTTSMKNPLKAVIVPRRKKMK